MYTSIFIFKCIYILIDLYSQAWLGRWLFRCQWRLLRSEQLVMLPIVWMLSKLRFSRVLSGDKCGREGPGWVSVNTNYQAVIHCSCHNQQSTNDHDAPHLPGAHTRHPDAKSITFMAKYQFCEGGVMWVIVDTKISCFSQSDCHYSLHPSVSLIFTTTPLINRSTIHSSTVIWN